MVYTCNVSSSAIDLINVPTVIVAYRLLWVPIDPNCHAKLIVGGNCQRSTPCAAVCHFCAQCGLRATDTKLYELPYSDEWKQTSHTVCTSRALPGAIGYDPEVAGTNPPRAPHIK